MVVCKLQLVAGIDSGYGRVLSDCWYALKGILGL
jgi:hypothetical protein